MMRSPVPERDLRQHLGSASKPARHRPISKTRLPVPGSMLPARSGLSPANFSFFHNSSSLTKVILHHLRHHDHTDPCTVCPHRCVILHHQSTTITAAAMNKVPSANDESLGFTLNNATLIRPISSICQLVGGYAYTSAFWSDCSKLRACSANVARFNI